VSDPAGVVAARALAVGFPFNTNAIGVSASGSGAYGGTTAGTDPFDTQRTDRFNGIVDLHLGDHTLTSQTSYTSWSSPRLTDLDFTAANLFNIQDDERSKTFTQELRLASPTGKRFQYLIGLFYYYNRWSYGRTFGGAPANSVGFPLVGTAASQTVLPTRSYSAFASGTYEIVDGLKLDAGVRYTHEKKEGTFARSTTGTLAGPFPSIPFTVYTPQVTKPVDFNVGLRYEPTSRILLYGSYSKGSKSGGFQDAPTTVAGAPFKPETAYSAEIGAKIRFTEGYLTLAAFNTRVRGFQTSYTTPVGNPAVVQTVIGNSNVRSRGAEANLSYEIVPGLTFSGNLVYANSVFTDDFPANASIGRKGDQLTRAPKWSGNAGVDYEHDIGAVALFAGASTDFASKTLYQFVVPQPTAPFGASHGIINARVGIRAPDKRWEVALLGTNLADRRYVEFATSVTAGGGAYYGSYNRPRVIALQLTLKQ
jgi:outer membrane receptor protein involved in Fe transport